MNNDEYYVDSVSCNGADVIDFYEKMIIIQKIMTSVDLDISIPYPISDRYYKIHVTGSDCEFTVEADETDELTIKSTIYILDKGSEFVAWPCEIKWVDNIGKNLIESCTIRFGTPGEPFIYDGISMDSFAVSYNNKDEMIRTPDEHLSPEEKKLREFFNGLKVPDDKRVGYEILLKGPRISYRDTGKL